MSANTFGDAFRIITFGESHGPYIGVVIDGVRPGIRLDINGIQNELDRRRPGQSSITTPRREEDRVEVVSGIFEEKTTGTPICMLIKNSDPRSQDYQKLKNIFRPGHAGYTFLKKYGIYDYRGGGRASGRETAARVAAGAVAKQLLDAYGIKVTAFTRQVGKIRGKSVDYAMIDENPVRAADPGKAGEMAEYIKKVAREGDSVGGVVEIHVQNCPAGLGEPVFHKLESEFAAALMSIGAVKGFEIGDGFAAAAMCGSEHNDGLAPSSPTGQPEFTSNHAGGVLGGISSGQPIVLRIAVKPTSSVRKVQNTMTLSGEPIAFRTTGRHDPCICPRIVPVAEAMVRLVLIDHILLQERISAVAKDSLRSARIQSIDTELLLLFAQRCNFMAETGKHTEQNVPDYWNDAATALHLPPEIVNRLYQLLSQAGTAKNLD